MELLHKALDFQVRQVGDPADRVLEFIGSTADVDRYGDVIEVAGWDLKHYQKNPQFLWAHNYSVPPVGTTRKVAKTDGGLAFHVYFFTDDEINAKGWPSHVPTPETVYQLYRVGGLRATSVGFQGLEYEPILGEPEGDQGYRPRTGTRYKKQDLYELSAVPVPANPYALMNAVQKGIISEEQARLFPVPMSPETKANPTDNEHSSEPTIIEVRLTPAEFKEAMAEGLREFLKDVGLEFLLEVGPSIKAGAVLSAKNKTALKNAQAMIQQVLDAAEPAEEGKGAAPEPSIYSLALNPGEEPHGERQAGEVEDVDVEEVRTLTQNLHLTVCK